MPASTYDPDKALRIPLDARLWIPVLYLASVGIMLDDSIDGKTGILSRWAMMIAVGAVGWLCITLHCYTRRVILDVVSWQNRQAQQEHEAGQEGTLLSVVDDLGS